MIFHITLYTVRNCVFPTNNTNINLDKAPKLCYKHLMKQRPLFVTHNYFPGVLRSKTPKLKKNDNFIGIFLQHGTLFALSLSLSLYICIVVSKHISHFSHLIKEAL